MSLHYVDSVCCVVCGALPVPPPGAAGAKPVLGRTNSAPIPMHSISSVRTGNASLSGDTKDCPSQLLGEEDGRWQVLRFAGGRCRYAHPRCPLCKSHEDEELIACMLAHARLMPAVHPPPLRLRPPCPRRLLCHARSTAGLHSICSQYLSSQPAVAVCRGRASGAVPRASATASVRPFAIRSRSWRRDRLKAGFFPRLQLNCDLVLAAPKASVRSTSNLMCSAISAATTAPLQTRSMFTR